MSTPFESRLKEAKQIEKSIQIPDLIIKNYISYLRIEASEKSTFAPCCGCIRTHLEISPAFHKAFKTFTREQKIDFYFKAVTLLKKCIDGERQLPTLQDPIKVVSIFFFNQDEGNWQTRRTELNLNKKTLKFNHGESQIDLHYYILRNSKKKDRKSLALESTEKQQKPQTIRISNYKESFEQLKETLQTLIFDCLREYYMKKLDQSGKIFSNRKNLPTQFKLLKIPSIKDMEGQQTMRSQNQNRRSEDLGSLMSPPPPHLPVNGLEYQKTKVKLINSLTNFANLRQTSKNIYIDLKQNRVRKIFEVKQEDYSIPLQWFSDNLMSASSFKRWKKTLKEVKTLSPLRENPNEKIFYEVHQFKQQITASYLFRRQKYLSEEHTIFFFDISCENPHPHHYPNLNTKNKIEYTVWKFQRTPQGLIITVEAKINHEHIKVGNLSVSLSQQFLGEVDRMCQCHNVTLLQDSNFHVNSAFFEDLFFQEYVEGNSIDDDQSFFSIVDNSEGGQGGQSVPSTFIRVRSKPTEQVIQLPILKSAGSISSPNANNMLKWRHPVKAFPKSANPKYRFPQTIGLNPFWQDEFRITDKGVMIHINQKKKAAQKGILKSLAKGFGKNLFSGKSILNISLPVTIFSHDSNLSILCKSYCYAPKLLEKAASQPNPEVRFKYVVAFSLGCTNAYIQMDKPFNPILGQTFHGLIDGCVIYGQQTSHHPPISSIFFKGRGYSVYGNFEAKVNLGLNSATGSNEGVTHVSFDQSDYHSKLIKFNVPGGEVGGVMWGDRTIKCVNKPQYLDVDNRLFLELTFAKHKGTTQFCKFQNGVEGKMVKLKEYVDLSGFPNLKIGKKDIERQIGIFSGQWTSLLLFQDEVVFKFTDEYPHMPEAYPCPLESDAFFRQDLLLRIDQKMEQAQTAKQELQNIQRNDRKLREKYGVKEQ